MTPDWLLYLITDRHLTGQRSLPEALAEALQGGIRAIQLREKDLSPRALLALAAEVRALTTASRVVILINDRIDVMLAVGADGVHLRTDSLPTRIVRRILGPEKLIGVSTHSIEEVWRAADEGADFVTFGPVFETPSKMRYGPPVGVEALADVCRHSGVPVFALGGITRDRIAAVVGAGAYGVAMISEIMVDRDTQSAARACVATVSASKVSRAVDPGFRRCYN